ncbi:MAG: GNAT family N-acetyltransferase [Treponemataceae bacterium]|nr:MAG: GNAT family N-acetyltransferase [Treponemataceae bacterium]
MDIENEIIIKPVSQNNWEDFELLFESKGGPSYCWCMAWRMTKDELKNNTKENRKKFIKKRVFANIPIGIVCYKNNDAIAWCSIAPRETYKRLGGDESINNVWSIVCFYIKKEYRNKGYIEILIQNAKKYAKENGAEFIEAYPVELDSPSYRFMGFIKTFEKAGFEYIKKAGTRRNVMLYKL